MAELSLPGSWDTTMARWMFGSLIGTLVAAVGIVACAEPDKASPSAGGSGNVGGGACTAAPDCAGCASCVDICACWGTDALQCNAQCAGSSGGAGGGSGAAGAAGAGGTAGAAGAAGVGGSGAVGASGGSGGSSSSSGGWGGSGGSGSCCKTSLSPGCDNPAIEACVCAIDAYCCTHAWDAYCVQGVGKLDCGSCGSGGSGGSGGGCGWQLQDPLCSACMQSKCCAQANACFNDAGCVTLGQCITKSCPNAATIADISSCIDTTCVQYAGYKSSMMGYLNCLSTQCSAQCGI